MHFIERISYSANGFEWRVHLMLMFAKKCEHCAKMIVVQQFRFPEAYSEDLMKIVAYTREQFEILEKSISRLFAKFGELLQDHSILDEIRSCESKVDALEERLYEQIFSMDMDLASKMQMMHFVELVCDVSDIIENIADKIQIVLITKKA